jgi:hypothetical protein
VRRGGILAGRIVLAAVSFWALLMIVPDFHRVAALGNPVGAGVGNHDGSFLVIIQTACGYSAIAVVQHPAHVRSDEPGLAITLDNADLDLARGTAVIQNVDQLELVCDPRWRATRKLW